MRRKKISAHFALSSRRLKVAVVSSFRGSHLATMMAPPSRPSGVEVGYPPPDPGPGASMYGPWR
eukprot:COSAG01_NODE_48717_length_378_cov_2.465950_2_plen_63_part_01